jgi:hypothetical protein
MEPTSVETESVAVHEEVPTKEAEVKTVRALKKRYGDQHLAVGHCQQLKKWTQGNGGSQKKLAMARGGMTRAIPVPRNGHGHQGPNRDNAARATPIGQTFRKRHQA